MEDTFLLDTSCELDLAALHFVYIPRIQQSLDTFAAAFANRPLRTEHRQTPLQLFIAGQVQNASQNPDNTVS